mgnify:CR=1 FL=1
MARHAHRDVMNHILARPVPDAISCPYLGCLTAKRIVDIEGFFGISRVLQAREFFRLGLFATFEDCRNAALDELTYLHEIPAILCKGSTPARLFADDYHFMHKKRPFSLLLPCLPRQKAQVVEADRRRLAAAGQAFEHLRRQIGEVQLVADMAFGQAGGLGQFLDRGELACLHAPPPAPCPGRWRADGVNPEPWRTTFDLYARN